MKVQKNRHMNIRGNFDMNIEKKHSYKRGLTIEYVLVMMFIIIAFIAVMLTTMTFSSEKAGEYREYIDQKQFLDNMADTFIAKKQGKDVSLEKFNNNEFGFTWREEGNTLIVLWDRIVMLQVEVSDLNGIKQPVLYIYGII